jgi:predicted NBD/HSP70 family sugar kinase
MILKRRQGPVRSLRAARILLTVSVVQRLRSDRHANEAWRSVPRPARPILRELVMRGPQTRTALARQLGLSTGSLTRLTKPLVEAGLIVERDIEHDPVNGRPTRPLEVVADGLGFLGIKLTSERVYAVLTNLRADVVASESAPLMDLAPGTVVTQVGRLASLLVEDGDPVAACVAVGGDAHAPAQIEESELLDSGLMGWEQVPLRRLMAERLGIPCQVKNDVAALAYSHQWFGDARGTSDFALITVGDGIGYALFVHGRAVRTTEADLGDFAHQILDPGGPMCPSGHRGCGTSFVSTASMLMAAAQGMRRFPTYEEVMGLAAAGDPVCSQVVRQAARALGILVANVTNTTMVKTVILAGEAVDIAHVAREDFDRGMAARRGNSGGIRLVVRPHDFTEWARGAAVVAIRDHVSGRQ